MSRPALRLGVIGYGAIAAELFTALRGDDPLPLAELRCIARRGAEDRAAELLALHPGLAARTGVTTGDDGFAGLDVVVECAGHEALHQHGERVLDSGADLVVASVGALADEALHRTLLDAAARGGRMHLAPGAIGGIDLLVASRLAGLSEVTYRGRKPPHAWRGTPAEPLIGEAPLAAPLTFYRGDAGEAARSYPKNANVAATVALAGLGFARTRVELVADPGISRNVHEIEWTSRAGRAAIRIENEPSPANPKSSLGVAYSLARTVRNLAGAVVI
jgi:aspartate dehydrogenase